MAQLIVPPSNKYICPVFKSGDNFDAFTKREDQFEKSLVEWAKDSSTYQYAGNIIRFPIADGYAKYVVYNGHLLAHIETSDAYAIPSPYLRGLTSDDIEASVKFENHRNALFEKYDK
jgi:hypothetical protein